MVQGGEYKVKGKGLSDLGGGPESKRVGLGGRKKSQEHREGFPAEGQVGGGDFWSAWRKKNQPIIFCRREKRGNQCYGSI